MAQKNAATEDAPDVTDSEAHAEANSTAQYLNEHLSWNVMARNWDGNIIIVSSNEDHVTTNGFAKGHVINEVLELAPRLEVRSTEDGDMAVTFEFTDD